MQWVSPLLKIDQLSEHLGVAIVNLALVGFLCNLRLQYIFRILLILILRSNFIFRYAELSDTIFSTGLINFIYFDELLLKFNDQVR